MIFLGLRIETQPDNAAIVIPEAIFFIADRLDFGDENIVDVNS